jgi:hypothetical protein
VACLRGQAAAATSWVCVAGVHFLREDLSVRFKRRESYKICSVH